MKLLDGKKTAEYYKNEMKKEIEEIKKEKGRTPTLAVVLVGDNPASKIYVRNKKRTGEEIGINVIIKEYDSKIEKSFLIDEIDKLNDDKNIDGILVQLPLPKHIKEDEIVERISPKKDVDGFTAENLGLLMRFTPRFIPCTPLGIRLLFEKYDIDTSGKHIAIIGRSNIVGKPAGMLFLQKGRLGDATITYLHSRSKDIKALSRLADIVIVAIGKAKAINRDYIREGAIVVDVGINKTQDGKLVGDVDFEDVKDKVSYITPVPGGVGPMTIIGLMKNIIKAFYINIA
jgi:methylenetetrahydrofolate dehydrogenase (NADP+)/methenyltetrahydrofolate cyclohydrolase